MPSKVNFLVFRTFLCESKWEREALKKFQYSKNHDMGRSVKPHTSVQVQFISEISNNLVLIFDHPKF